MKARISVFAVALLSIALAPGCNTVKGLGKDVTTAGEKTEALFTGEKSATQPN